LVVVAFYGACFEKDTFHSVDRWDPEFLWCSIRNPGQCF
jgi:hypothetical protein